MPRLLLDEAALTAGYVPATLPFREKELARLTALFAPVVRARLPCHALITGPVGAGKTALAHALARDLKVRAFEGGGSLEWVYLNLRRESSDLAVWLKLLRTFDPQFPDRGF